MKPGIADPTTSSAVAERRTLTLLLLINAAMFIVEAVTGWIADSMGLIADSLDMFADAGVCLRAVGGGFLFQAQGPCGWSQRRDPRRGSYPHRSGAGRDRGAELSAAPAPLTAACDGGAAHCR